MSDSKRRGYLSTVICVVTHAVTIQQAAAIVTSETGDNHVVVPGSTTYGLNLDGVGLLGFQKPGSTNIADVITHCSGALITDRHVLTAAHCFDADEDGQIDTTFSFLPLTFVAETSTEVTFVEVDPAMISLPNEWPQSYQDIAVVELTAPLPAELPRYRLNSAADELGRPVVLAGYGAPGYGATGAVDETGPPTKRAGLNRVDAIRGDIPGVEFLTIDFDSGQPANNALALNGFDSDLGFGADEALPGPGDSGGPLFIDGRIAAVTSFVARMPEADVDSVANDSWGEGGFATRVANFEAFVLSATNGSAIFVPEPQSSLLVLIATVMLGLRGSRHLNRSL